MSYSIIFQTKIMKLNDGRVVHFSRSGCNNDDAGRVKNVYEAKIYEENDFIKYANGFMVDSKPGKEADGFDLRIGNKYATYYDYGKYLLRALKQAKNIDEFNDMYIILPTVFRGVQLLEPENKVLNPKEFNDMFYDLVYRNNNVSYRRLIHMCKSLEEGIKELESGNSVEFLIKK